MLAASQHQPPDEHTLYLILWFPATNSALTKAGQILPPGGEHLNTLPLWRFTEKDTRSKLARVDQVN
jgi:hypothetical protein